MLRTDTLPRELARLWETMMCWHNHRLPGYVKVLVSRALLAAARRYPAGRKLGLAEPPTKEGKEGQKPEEGILNYSIHLFKKQRCLVGKTPSCLQATESNAPPAPKQRVSRKISTYIYIDGVSGFGVYVSYRTRENARSTPYV